VTGLDGTQADEGLESLAEHLGLFVERAGHHLGFDLACSIMVVDAGEVRQAASSDPRAAHCDEVEAAEYVGPCVDAMESLQAVLVPDLRAETRWPSWRSTALATGFRSAAAFPAHLAWPARAALNVYSERLDPWDRDTVVRCDVYAQMIGAVVDLCLRTEELDRRRAALETALEAQAAIDRAVGAVMATSGCDAAEALRILRTATRQGESDLPEVARTVLQRLADAHPR
jgi:hypothetical protein